MDREQTILGIQRDGEHQQRLGDACTAQGLNEKAATHYARAKVAREEGLILQSNVEAADPERCYEVQELLASATQYDLVKWCLTDDPDQDDEE